MTTINPLSYPLEPHVRIHGPAGYKDYTTYKPFLRDEFSFRCVFCLEREQWHPNRYAGFSVEHFVPKSVCPEKECDYDNLLYACLRCNSFKQTILVRLDPTQTAFAEHFVMRGDGQIEGLSTESKDLIDLLHLNESPAIDLRRQILLLVRLKQLHPHDTDVGELCFSYFKYPDDLPDLDALKPPKNTRRDGLKTSHRARKSRNELPEVY